MIVDGYPVPGWAWVVNRGSKVAFGGVSVVEEGQHPWLHEATKSHVLVSGVWTLDAINVVETERFSGWRMDQLMTAPAHAREIDRLVAEGGVILR